MDRTYRRVVSWVASSGLHVALIVLVVFGSILSLSQHPSGDRLVAVVTLPEPSLAEVIADNNEREQALAGQEVLALPGLGIDISRIRNAQDELFPLLTEGLPDLGERRRAAGTGEPLRWFGSGAPDGSRQPPLTLNDAEMNRILDDAWSRRDRWQSFAEIATLVSEHDPDAGRAAELLREHIDRNLLQPYRRSTPPDEQFWTFLNMAVDQKPIIRFVQRYVREHPGSRVAIELLFFLDELMQANHATLMTLLVVEPTRDLALTREIAPAAHALAVEIHGRYARILRDRGIEMPDGIRDLYAEGRTTILRTILDTAPGAYGQADARYLLGRISWDEGRRDEAMGWWREIEDDSRGLYAPYYAVILPEVHSPTAMSLVQINRVFGAEHLAWRRASTARLQQFGYGPGDY